MLKPLFHAACLMLAGCIEGERDLSKTYEVVTPLAVGTYSTDANKERADFVIVDGSYHQRNKGGGIQDAAYTFLNVPGGDGVMIVQFAAKGIEGFYYYFAGAPDQDGRMTIYDFEPSSSWLLPTDIRTAVDVGNDSLKIRSASDTDRVLRTIMRNRLEFDPSVRHITLSPLNPPGPAKQDATDAATAATPPAPAKSQTRVALVIGNSAYRNVPWLSNPRHDAEGIAASFKALGFQTVDLDLDVTQAEFLQALRRFRDAADEADWAVVYFAGHGMEASGRNYLLPVDARLKSDRDVEDETVSLDRVLDAISGARALKLVILDACRSNPFAATMKRRVSSRSAERGLARVEPPDASVLVVYAAEAGATADDGNAVHSPFADALLRRMNQPGLEIRRLFDLVAGDVLKRTGRSQRPFTYGSIPGEVDFYIKSQR